MRQRTLQVHQQFAALNLQMRLRYMLLVSKCRQPRRGRFTCRTASLHRQGYERGRSRRLSLQLLSLLTHPTMHHVRVQSMGQGHTAYTGSRLCAAGQHLGLELLAVLTPPWADLIQRVFHRVHDPPSWGRCPLQAGRSRWDRQPHTSSLPYSALHPAVKYVANSGRSRIRVDRPVESALQSGH